MGSTPAKLELTKGLNPWATARSPHAVARISVAMLEAEAADGWPRLRRARRAAPAGPPLWLSTHRVNSRQRSISVASGAKRMLTEPRLQKIRLKVGVHHKRPNAKIKSNSSQKI
jgi:hypothetical protein